MYNIYVSVVNQEPVTHVTVFGFFYIENENDLKEYLNKNISSLTYPTYFIYVPKLETLMVRLHPTHNELLLIKYTKQL